MKIVIGHINRTISLLENQITDYKIKAGTHEMPEMKAWYKDRVKTNGYEIQELAFIRDMIERERKTMEVTQ